jgi:hypothetical protein
MILQAVETLCDFPARFHTPSLFLMMRALTCSTRGFAFWFVGFRALTSQPLLIRDDLPVATRQCQIRSELLHLIEADHGLRDQATSVRDEFPYQLAADIVLAVHACIVVFVVGGHAVVFLGNLRGWHWVNRWSFRLAHLAAIAFVVAQTWVGQLCPLTTLESWLRVQAGSPAYNKSFVEHWVQRFLYYDAPFWVFTLAYTVFGLLVIAAWRVFPPRRNMRK